MTCCLTRSCWLSSIAFALALVTAIPLGAQERVPADSGGRAPSATPATAPVASVLATAPLGVRPAPDAPDSAAATLQSASFRRMDRPKYLMIGGAGAAIVGLVLIGGDVGGGIAVAGMLVGIYGLYSTVK